MKPIARILGFVALGLTIVPPILVATDVMGDAMMKGLMLAGFALWFTMAPVGMRAGDR